MIFITMGDLMLDCPLCCNMKFSSKQSLVEHLSSFNSKLFCPVCELNFSSLDLLIDHLKLDKCAIANEASTSIFEEASKDVTNTDFKQLNNDAVTEDMENNLPNTDNVGNDLVNTISVNTSNEGTEANKMYVELISNESMKPCPQKQEVKLLEEDGKNKYFIFTDDSLLISDKINSNTVVTKNNDGTISLTTIKDSELDVKKEALNSVSTTAVEDTEEKEEIYSCNTCGVSFSSVIEHIQNYHNDQEVVVEDSIDENETTDLVEYESVMAADTREEETAVKKEATRKIITQAGNIVQVPLQEEMIVPDLKVTKTTQVTKEIQYLQTDKLSNSLVKGTKENNAKIGSFHKVIMKEMTTQTGNKLQVYNCVLCNVYVTSLLEFQNHPCKTMKYVCPQCPVSYENSKSLCAHMKVHKTRSTAENFSVKFECEICSTIFPTSKSLKLHKRMHDPVKSRPLVPPMEMADGSAASKDLFLCSVCHKLIPIDYRVIHQNSHKANNNMTCDVCNKKFHSREYLEMHMSVHNLDKVTVGKEDVSLPYKCLYCNRKFARPHEKVKHERVHTGEKPHSCEICGKAFRVAYCLTLHMRTHTGARPYACPHCNKRFKAHSVYNHHLLTHSEVRAYKCPYCPKAFKTSVQLAGHKNSHTKPFSCQQCNRPFASLYAVRVHMEVHARQNSLKFSCSLCGASYARAFALNDHVKQAHQADCKEEQDPLDTII